MTLPVAVRAAARADFDEAFDWYEAQQVGLGVWFAERVHAVFGIIASGPSCIRVCSEMSAARLCAGLPM